MHTSRVLGQFLKTAGLAACIGVSLVTAPQAQADLHHSLRPDGSVIDWFLNIPRSDEPQGLILLAQGSGCLPVAQNDNIEDARQIFSHFASLTVEKYGIEPDSHIEDPFGNCPTAYHAHNTLSQRVADYAQVVHELAGQPWWNSKLVLFGGSMGGSAMAQLAAQVDADAVILLSTGGGVSFGEMVLQTVPEDAWPQLKQQFDDIRQHPDSTEFWAGYSYRYWADTLDYREVDDMLKSSAPILLIQGGRDSSTPVGVARATADLFEQAHRCNLTYWELPSLDHGMVDVNEQSHMASVLELAAGWLDQTLLKSDHPACAQPD